MIKFYPGIYFDALTIAGRDYVLRRNRLSCKLHKHFIRQYLENEIDVAYTVPWTINVVISVIEIFKISFDVREKSKWLMESPREH